MLSTFSRSVPSKVYEACIFLIRFLVSCIILHLTGWNLISHFLPQEPNRSISLWSFIFILNFTIAITVISKGLISDSVSDEMSFMYRESNKGPRTVPWGTPDKTGAVRFYSIYSNSLLSEAKKRICQFQCLATNSIVNNLLLKSSWGDVLNAFLKSNMNVSSIVQELSPIIYYRSQLSFTTVSFPECMLPIWQEFIYIKMSHDIWTYCVFE